MQHPAMADVPILDPAKLKIVRRIGRGGFASVYHSEYLGLGEVALKVYNPVQSTLKPRESQLFLSMFFREAQLVATSAHRNLVRCHGLVHLPKSFPGLDGISPPQTYGMVLEYCNAGTTRDLIMATALEGRHTYSNADALEWLVCVAEAVAHLHSLQPAVIHRDIKHDNVLLARDRRTGRVTAKLADLGLHVRVDANERSVMVRCKTPLVLGDEGGGTQLAAAPAATPFVAISAPNSEVPSERLSCARSGLLRSTSQLCMSTPLELSRQHSLEQDGEITEPSPDGVDSTPRHAGHSPLSTLDLGTGSAIVSVERADGSSYNYFQQGSMDEQQAVAAAAAAVGAGLMMPLPPALAPAPACQASNGATTASTAGSAAATITGCSSSTRADSVSTSCSHIWAGPGSVEAPRLPLPMFCGVLPAPASATQLPAAPGAPEQLPWPQQPSAVAAVDGRCEGCIGDVGAAALLAGAAAAAAGRFSRLSDIAESAEGSSKSSMPFLGLAPQLSSVGGSGAVESVAALAEPAASHLPDMLSGEVREAAEQHWQQREGRMTAAAAGAAAPRGRPESALTAAAAGTCEDGTVQPQPPAGAAGSSSVSCSGGDVLSPFSVPADAAAAASRHTCGSHSRTPPGQPHLTQPHDDGPASFGTGNGPAGGSPTLSASLGMASPARRMSYLSEVGSLIVIGGAPDTRSLLEHDTEPSISHHSLRLLLAAARDSAGAHSGGRTSNRSSVDFSAALAAVLVTRGSVSAATAAGVTSSGSSGGGHMSLPLMSLAPRLTPSAQRMPQAATVAAPSSAAGTLSTGLGPTAEGTVPSGSAAAAAVTHSAPMPIFQYLQGSAGRQRTANDPRTTFDACSSIADVRQPCCSSPPSYASPPAQRSWLAGSHGSDASADGISCQYTAATAAPASGPDALSSSPPVTTPRARLSGRHLAARGSIPHSAPSVSMLVSPLGRPAARLPAGHALQHSVSAGVIRSTSPSPLSRESGCTRPETGIPGATAAGGGYNNAALQRPATHGSAAAAAAAAATAPVFPRASAPVVPPRVSATGTGAGTSARFRARSRPGSANLSLIGVLPEQSLASMFAAVSTPAPASQGADEPNGSRGAAPRLSGTNMRISHSKQSLGLDTSKAAAGLPHPPSRRALLSMALSSRQQQQEEEEGGGSGGAGTAAATAAPAPGLTASMDMVVSSGSFSQHMRRIKSITQLLKSHTLPKFERPSLEWVFNLTGRAGSCCYMAPEVYRREPYNEKADVYSFGMIMYELLARELLLQAYVGTRRGAAIGMKTPPDYARAASDGFRPPRPAHTTQAQWELVCRCWQADPCARPSMGQVAEVLQQLLAQERRAARHGGYLVDGSEGVPAGCASCGCTIC